MMRGSLLLLASLAALATPAGAGGLGSRLLVGRWSPRYTPQPVKFEERRGSFILPVSFVSLINSKEKS